MPISFAGLSLDRPRIMGILNVTPDSFSDGGLTLDPLKAVEAGERMIAEGADIVDVGGESTRPGAEPVPLEVELERVVPVISRLAARGHLVSVDTRHSAVMVRALDAGATIVNDVTALAGEPASLHLVARRRAPTVLMHMQGEPQSMQKQPRYGDVVSEVLQFLERRLAACRSAGMADDRLCIDYGIGFGKTLEHNLALLAATERFAALGVAVLVGVSRKAFIGRLSRGEPAPARAPGSIAAGLAAISRGAHILRVHDVAETAQALAVWRAVADAQAKPSTA